jgi:hypothetical protein
MRCVPYSALQHYMKFCWIIVFCWGFHFTWWCEWTLVIIIKSNHNITNLLIISTHKHKLQFQASATILMRTALFWDITRHRVVIIYRRFGTTYRTHLQGSRCPMTITTLHHVIPQKCADLINIAAKAWNQYKKKTYFKPSHLRYFRFSQRCGWRFRSSVMWR